ncbi:M1-specific T cell receptor beta chain-like isoform X2 [Toxotes jaculatrix]|uniref:M1-specific T cell receptor beta chain-like isoform X2 n=1 Tax=Toxotes jaculatrix TaxID=941984 RepID=UPI001B3B0C7E|nr:M1-specific T cell receptor beta chain-like isoform X2 [Toxotes jaculatrix]
MLFLPAAALCCLCSALVAMAAELTQDQLSLTRRVGQPVSFSCGGIHQCGDYIAWRQKKETETFRWIISLNKNTGELVSNPDHPQKDDFTAENKPNGCNLKIDTVKLDHSATYYCSCWKSGSGGYYYLIFGSGTKLYVTGEQVVKPVVSVYPAAPSHVEGNSSLLCLASGMFPPLVQFSWERQREDGPKEKLSPDEGEQLELREPRRASILLIHQPENSKYKYYCSVRHEGGTVEAPAQGAVDPLQPQCRVKLLCLLYTVLIVKSLLYCCGLSLLMGLTNKGPSTNGPHAD